jgi:predicted Zn-dependent protease
LVENWLSDDRSERVRVMKRLAVLLALQYVCCAQMAAPAAAAVQVSDADEIRVGEILAAKFIASEGIAPSPQNARIEAYLQKVGDAVAVYTQRKIPYRIHFDPNPAFRSAVGFPGGQVFVGAGILAYMDTEDQLAMVLGHEIEHIDLNQCHDRLVKELGVQHLTMKDVDKIAVEPFHNGYGHDGEFAADREGAILAMKAGYSADGAMRLLKTYVILGDQMPNTSNEAKANLEARIEQIRKIRDASTLPKPASEKKLALP